MHYATKIMSSNLSSKRRRRQWWKEKISNTDYVVVDKAAKNYGKKKQLKFPIPAMYN